MVENVITQTMQKRNRQITIALTALTAFLSGGYMYNAYTKDVLWGYWPLLMLLSAWFSITLLLLPRFSKHPNNMKRYLLSALTGVLLWLGFPMIPLTPVLFIAFIPLLLVEHDISKSREGASKWEVFKYSYFSFVLWNILTTYWVANTAFSAALLAFLVNSLFMCIPFVAFHQVKKVVPKLGWMAFVAFWITFEYLHLRQEATWPWLTLGNAFATFPSTIQWYEFTGVFGGSLWMLVGNVLLYKWLSPKLSTWIGLENKEAVPVGVEGEMERGDWIRVALFFVLPLAFSFYTYATHQEEGVAKEVVVVQPNFEPHYVKFVIPRQQTMAQFLKLSEEAVTAETDYLVFPETSFFRIRTNNLKTDKQIKALQDFVDKQTKLKLVTGLGTSKIYEKGEPHGPAVRVRPQRGRDTIFWESHNSAIQLKSGSKEIDFYLKSKFVPGAEIFPYHKILFFFKPIVEKLGGSISGFASQKERSVFKADGTAVAPVICYESVFGEYCTEYVQAGAEAIFIVTNDGWWDNTAGHRQHLAFAQLRAIENRRSIARSANSGISAFINQRGDIISATNYDEPAALKETILFNKARTFYSVWGDLIGRIAGYLAILIILNAISKGLMKRKGIASAAPKP
ncbi:MAG: apolipoprotein N-acyltransferase [Polaribacter sp.]